jgi:hypothetical protein
MTLDLRTTYWTVICLLVIPAPLLLASWSLHARRGFAPTRRTILVLLASTGSYGWLLLGVKFPIFLGAYYSNARFTIIDVNLVVNLLLTLFAFRRGIALIAIFQIAACLALATEWGLLGAINSVL